MHFLNGYEDQDGDGLCDGCSSLDIVSIFNSEQEKGFKISGICVRMRESHKCPLCRLALRRLPQREINQDVEKCRPGQYFMTAEAQRDILQISYTGQHRGVVRRASFRSPEELRRDHASTLDYTLIKSWLNECETKHGDDCNFREFGTSRYRFPTDLTLIDTLEHRLVEGQSDLRYAALSYVWGGVRMLTTTTKNFQSLQQRGALSPDRADLPKVVQDAMKLTDMLGERYLWVDCLCIEQDSPQKHHDIARMDVIYTHAHFTIVAIDGNNANTSLPGIQPSSRSPVQPVIRIRGQQLTSQPPSLGLVLKSSTYDTRGWTLQERALSRRCLYISEQQIYFQCNVSTREEIQPNKDSIGKSTMSRINDLRLQGSLGLGTELAESLSPGATKRYWFDGLPIYQELVEIYSARNLSYAEDVANAFSGFSSLLTECCGGIFLSCIPTAALAAALLWAPNEPTSRRISLKGPSFPSWSWAGWLGETTYSTGSNKQMNAPAENLELEMEQLEIFVNDASSVSDVELSNNCGRIILPAIGAIQDFSLQRSPHIQLKHLSMLTYPNGGHVPCELLPVVDTLRFKAWSARRDRVYFTRARFSTLKSVVKICSREDKKPYGVLFGLQDTDWDYLTSNVSFDLIAISRVDNISNWEELVDDYGVVPPSSWRFFGRNEVFNVMLVKKKGLFSERAAIGKIFDKYWHTIKGELTTFVLI